MAVAVFSSCICFVLCRLTDVSGHGRQHSFWLRCPRCLACWEFAAGFRYAKVEMDFLGSTPCPSIAEPFVAVQRWVACWQRQCLPCSALLTQQRQE